MVINIVPLLTTYDQGCASSGCDARRATQRGKKREPRICPPLFGPGMAYIESFNIQTYTYIYIYIFIYTYIYN